MYFTPTPKKEEKNIIAYGESVPLNLPTLKNSK